MHNIGDVPVRQTGRYLVRAFDREKDLDAVYRCFVSSFYHNSWPLIDHAERRLLEDSLMMVVGMSHLALVAESDGEARGILTGFYPKEGLTLLRAALYAMAYKARVALRLYRMDAFARAAFWRHTLGEFSYLARSPNTPAEVLLLGSQEEYRGGIGRAMMDVWVAETKARGYRKTTVGTDSTVSYDFYERYGFSRIRDFPLKSYFHSLPGVEVRGYIYSLDIE